MVELRSLECSDEVFHRFCVVRYLLDGFRYIPRVSV
jgi:hypothetical protein